MSPDGIEERQAALDSRHADTMRAIERREERAQERDDLDLEMGTYHAYWLNRVYP
jgi:hypothetical protein